MRDERGFTLVELLVAMALSIVVLFAILALVQVTTEAAPAWPRSVEANQQRPRRSASA